MRSISSSSTAAAVSIALLSYCALSAEMFRAHEASGSAPLNTTLMVAAGGASATTINYKFHYAFWWNGADTTTNAGDTRPPFGDPSRDVNGAKLDGLSLSTTAQTGSRDDPLPDKIAGSDRIFFTDQGRGYFVDVMRAAAFGMRNTERAAFIVEQNDGSLGCQPWPAWHLQADETFRGVIPKGTLAIIHTHPTYRGKLPSAQDHLEAIRLGIPIYVLTRNDIYKTSTEISSSLPVVQDELWFKRRAPEQQTAHCLPMPR
jgi:hypothetical protein